YSNDGTAGAAVDNLSLTVLPGEICVLVGPSGCGKTTTLRMVNRLVEPTSGQILIDGQDVSRIAATALRRRIGYVIQQTGLFPHRTIAQNVATVPELLGWPRERTERRVEELLLLIGLDPARVRNRYPSELSGGERQRVGVARALAAEPPVMLMDEPFGAVDPITREHLQNEFLRLHRQLRTTVIFVTHDVDEAIKMGNQVAVLQQGGRLAQYAPPSELLTRPASDFVARFVGVDRGLKRLTLISVEDFPLEKTSTAHEGEIIQPPVNATDAYTLLLDPENRPIGWINLSRRPPGSVAALADADASSPFLESSTTLRDALSMLLGADVQTAVVVDEHGRYRGVLTLQSIAAKLRGTTVAQQVNGEIGAELALDTVGRSSSSSDPDRPLP
ncbi:MAG: ABC transporter ATP-binding protein, partial [Chloroflexota bacterium]|nr:ABC transporter ATP-binding protein [Chloroflexota bacterium]